MATLTAPHFTESAKLPRYWALSSSGQSAGKIYGLLSYSDYCSLEGLRQAVFSKCQGIFAEGTPLLREVSEIATPLQGVGLEFSKRGDLPEVT